MSKENKFKIGDRVTIEMPNGVRCKCEVTGISFRDPFNYYRIDILEPEGCSYVSTAMLRYLNNQVDESRLELDLSYYRDKSLGNLGI